MPALPRRADHRGDHLIVCGDGPVNGQLNDLGFDVVCVDDNPDAPGIAMARQLGLPVVIGDATREQTLRAASPELRVLGCGC